MTADELQSLLNVLDDAVCSLDFDCGCAESGGCKAADEATRVAVVLKPQRDAVREAWLRAVRVEAMGDSE